MTKRYQPEAKKPDISCPNQFGGRLKVSAAWCDLAQSVEWCRGCSHNQGRETSKHKEPPVAAVVDGFEAVGNITARVVGEILRSASKDE